MLCYLTFTIYRLKVYKFKNIFFFVKITDMIFYFETFEQTRISCMIILLLYVGFFDLGRMGAE